MSCRTYIIRKTSPRPFKKNGYFSKKVKKNKVTLYHFTYIMNACTCIYRNRQSACKHPAGRYNLYSVRPRSICCYFVYSCPKLYHMQPGCSHDQCLKCHTERWIWKITYPALRCYNKEKILMSVFAYISLPTDLSFSFFRLHPSHCFLPGTFCLQSHISRVLLLP